MTSLFASLAALEVSGQAAALCTVIRARGSVPRHVGSKLLVYADGRIEGSIGGGALESRVIVAAQEALRTGQASLVQHQLVDPTQGDPGVCGGEVEIFVEPLRPRPTLLVIGGGHVGQAVVHLGHWLGFCVILTDDRPEFCAPEATPGADVYLPGAFLEVAAQVPFTPDTYIVLSTRGSPVDVALLPFLLARPHAYLGVIGSRRRWAVTVKQLVAAGISEDQLAHVRAPMGLEIHAETPEEIALSVMAEIIQRRRGEA
jgi:xanthine dehydrogenase accessory factor